MASKSMDQEQMLLIVVLVGALLYMFMKNHKGGICSLFGGNKDTFIISGQGNNNEIIAPDHVQDVRNAWSAGRTKGLLGALASTAPPSTGH